MVPKSIDEIFAEIDYSNTLNIYIEKGYKLLEKYMNELGQNTIEDEKEIKLFLSKFMSELQHTDVKISKDIGYLFLGYEPAMTLLHKLYPIKQDHPFYKFKENQFSLSTIPKKTERIVIDIMRTGRDGGVRNILTKLVILDAEYAGELKINYYMEDNIKNLSSEKKIELAKEYLQKYGDYIPEEYKTSISYFSSFHFENVIAEHPKMMFRMQQLEKTKSSKDN